MLRKFSGGGPGGRGRSGGVVLLESVEPSGSPAIAGVHLKERLHPSCLMHSSCEGGRIVHLALPHEI